MSDELVESAEFGKKKKDEEEPILVAQRFLNIYRQMHIFNKERQNQFDDILLSLPSDIRILLSTLPGGSLLLEHIEEVEHKRGLVSPDIKTETNLRKKSANDLLQNAVPAVSKPEAAPKQVANSGGGVVIDASFASELSNSLSFALQQTEKRYKDDIRTLTENITRSIMESQSAIANMMKDIMLASQGKAPAFSNTPAQNNSTIAPVANDMNATKSIKEDIKPQVKETKPETAAVKPEMQTQSVANTVADKVQPNNKPAATPQPAAPNKQINEHLSDKRPLPLSENLIKTAPNNLTETIKADKPSLPVEIKEEKQPEKSKPLPKAEDPLNQIRQALQNEPAKTEKQPAANNKNNQANKNNQVSKDSNQPAPKKKNKSTLVIPEDIVSLADLPNTPVSLDDIPDTPISLDDIPDSSLTENPVTTTEARHEAKTETPSTQAGSDDDWEWEYVDENGNSESGNDDNWEWEYVEDDGNSDESDGADWEWEYVEDDSDTSNNKKS